MSLGISYDRWKSQNSSSPPPVILASGPETSLKEEFLDSQVKQTEGNPEVLTLYADEISPEEFLQELRGQGLFNKRKWVVLRNLNKKTRGGKRVLEQFFSVIKSYSSDPEPETWLVLFDIDHPYRNSRKLGSMAETITQEDGWSIIFWEPFDRSLRETIQERLTEAGLDFDPAAVQLLLEFTKGKYSRIESELDKLIDAVEGRVSRSDVNQIVSREEAGDLLNSLKDNFVQENLSALMTDYDDLWRQNESPPKIVHVLYQFLNDLRTIRQLTADGKSIEDALRDLGRPTSRDVKQLYKKGLNWIKKNFPNSFYREFYELEKNSKYLDNDLSELTIETKSLQLSKTYH